MKDTIFNSKLAEIKNKLTIWMVIAVGMSASNFLLVIFLFMLQSPEKTIIVPTEIRSSFWVQGDQVSPEYYSEMAEVFVSKMLNYNSANAEGQFAEVLKFMDPVGFNVMQGKMKAEAADIKSRNMSSAFYQQEIKVVGKNVLGYGELVSMMSGQTIGIQKIGYKLEFDYRNGKLFVKKFERVAMPTTGIAGYEEMLKQQIQPEQSAQPQPAQP